MATAFVGTALFCDDLRHEINGKLSLMGVYTGDMYVPHFPITLPKICAFIELHIPLDQTADVIVTVMKGAEKLSTISLNHPPQENFPAETKHGKPYVYKHMAGAMEFPAMTFEEACLLDVIAQCGDQSLVAGRLWVTTFPKIEEPAVSP